RIRRSRFRTILVEPAAVTATSRGVAVISSGCGRLLAGPPLVYHEGRPELAADTRAEAAEQASIEQMQQRSVVTASGESIRVEFYGLARQRAATSSTSVAAGHSMTLGSLWQELVERFPRLAQASAADDELIPQA